MWQIRWRRKRLVAKYMPWAYWGNTEERSLIAKKKLTWERHLTSSWKIFMTEWPCGLRQRKSLRTTSRISLCIWGLNGEYRREGRAGDFEFKVPLEHYCIDWGLTQCDREDTFKMAVNRLLSFKEASESPGDREGPQWKAVPWHNGHTAWAIVIRRWKEDLC